MSDVGRSSPDTCSENCDMLVEDVPSPHIYDSLQFFVRDVIYAPYSILAEKSKKRGELSG